MSSDFDQAAFMRKLQYSDLLIELLLTTLVRPASSSKRQR
jgi:hypothetical protein